MSILKTLHIRAFKSILEQTVDLGQLNVFIGTNGAGKSNVLEALGILSSSAAGGITYGRMAERGVRLSAPAVFKSAFANIKRKKNFHLECEFDRLFYSININSGDDSTQQHPFNYHAERIARGKKASEKIAGRSNSYTGVFGIRSFDKSSLKNHQSIVPAAESLGAFNDEELKLLDALKNYAIYAPSTPILRGVANDESKVSPLGLYGGGLVNALRDVTENKTAGKYLSNFFVLLDWFYSIGIQAPSSELQSSHIHTGSHVISFKDNFMKRTFQDLYAYDVSEGALYVLFVLLLLYHPKAPRIFALDNVDNSLNPGLVINLISHLAEFLENHPDRQLFITTHNPTALDAIDLFNTSHRLFVVKRGKRGDTVFNRIEPPEGFTKEKWNEQYGNAKLSEIWLSGVLEGLTPVPDGF